MKTAGQRDRSALPLAAMPVLFGIQQFVEGLVWVGIGRENAALTHSAAVVYLFFAITFWLFWIPFSAACLESRKRMKFLLALGAVLGVLGGLAYCLPILLNPAALLVSVDHHSVRYDIPHFPSVEAISPLVGHVSYVVVVSLPLLLVAQKRQGLIFFSTALIVSAVISHAYFWYNFTSVWCFFAAIVSLVLGYMYHKLPMPTSGFLETPVVAPIPRPTAPG